MTSICYSTQEVEQKDDHVTPVDSSVNNTNLDCDLINQAVNVEQDLPLITTPSSNKLSDCSQRWLLDPLPLSPDPESKDINSFGSDKCHILPHPDIQGTFPAWSFVDRELGGLSWNSVQRLQKSKVSHFEINDRPLACGLDEHVPFSYYSFIRAEGLSLATAADVRFLESNGCLHLPSRTILSKLLQQYFLYVHPFLPLLSEREIWLMFTQTSRESECSKEVSLCVFQALLFACSSVS